MEMRMTTVKTLIVTAALLASGSSLALAQTPPTAGPRAGGVVSTHHGTAYLPTAGRSRHHNRMYMSARRRSPHATTSGATNGGY
jgi:hypothetical protein